MNFIKIKWMGWGEIISLKVRSFYSSYLVVINHVFVFVTQFNYFFQKATVDMTVPLVGNNLLQGAERSGVPSMVSPPPNAAVTTPSKSAEKVCFYS